MFQRSVTANKIGISSFKLDLTISFLILSEYDDLLFLSLLAAVVFRVQYR